jgi:hypothetical protein
MAMDTYALADLTDEPEIIAAYLEIAGRWLALADQAERGPGPDRDDRKRR